MNVWNDFFYYFIIGATLLLSALGLWFTAIMPGIDRWNKRFFRSFFIVLMLSVCTVLTDIALRANTAPSEVIRFMQVLECLLLALPLPMLTVSLLHCCKENMRESRLLQAVPLLRHTGQAGSPGTLVSAYAAAGNRDHAAQ